MADAQAESPPSATWDGPLTGTAAVLGTALWVTQALKLWSALEPASLPWVLAGALLGALLADGLTGLVHWACDTWGDERTPLLGPTLIYAFREHHHAPRKMLDYPWMSVNREPALAAALTLALLSLPPARELLVGHPGLHAAILALLAYGATANQLHQWAHADRPPRIVRLAQRAGLVLSPERHARHHRAPNTRAYCISTGWLNPLLDRIDFWRRLERLVSRATGAEARADPLLPRRIPTR